MITQPINDGGTAFPHTTVNNMGGSVLRPGMSLRDWFAGMALQGNLASQSIEVGYYDGEDAWQKAANDAYRTADAMIEARKKDYIIDRGEDK